MGLRVLHKLSESCIKLVLVLNEISVVLVSVRLKIGMRGDLNSSRVCQKCLSGRVHEV